MPTEPVPPVSVIMPVRNEEAFIERSLAAVLAQDYPAECLEVLVVDGRSDDATRALVRRMAAQQPGRNLLLLDNPARVAPHALNIGLRHAQGDVVVLVGGHCALAPDYLQRCVEALRKTGADCAGGILETVGETVTARAIALAQSAPFGVGSAAFRTGRAEGCYVDTVAFGAYRREVFDRLGGFDEELVRNQDDEFNFRLTQAGGKIWMDPSIRAVYYSRTSLRRLWRQYFEYGLYKVRLMQKRRAVPSWRHLVPAAFVSALLLSGALALGTGRGAWGLAVAGPYLVATLGASLWTARKDWRALPLLPLAFASLHLAYGAGFLRGLWHWRRNGQAAS